MTRDQAWHQLPLRQLEASLQAATLIQDKMSKKVTHHIPDWPHVLGSLLELQPLIKAPQQMQRFVLPRNVAEKERRGRQPMSLEFFQSPPQN